MNRKDIIVLPHKSLRIKSAKINHIDQKTIDFVEKMRDVALDWEDHRDHEYSVGLAAVQDNIMQKIVLLRDNLKNREDKSFTAYLNPKIIKYEGQAELVREGCLSVQDIYVMVPRYPKVKIQAMDIDGKIKRFTLRDFQAQVFQHEVDHTNGVTIVDRAGSDGEYYHMEDNGDLVLLTNDERAGFVRDYKIPDKAQIV